MKIVAVWAVLGVLSVAPVSAVELQKAIDVDCGRTGALERALVKAAKLESVELRLDGVCEGNFTIAGGDVTLRAASPGSGLAAAPGDPGIAPVLEIESARVALRGAIVRGGVIGVLVHGDDAELLLVEAEIFDQIDGALLAEEGATLRLLETTVREGNVGVVVDSGGTAYLQRSHISGFEEAMVVADRSFAGISDTVIENNRVGGLNVTRRSDVNVLGGAFRNNAQVHVNANDWSKVSLVNGVELGSPGDLTEFALGATRNSRVTCSSTPVIYGHAGVLDGASMRLYGAEVEGDCIASAFADAMVRGGAVKGLVFCDDGADVICSQPAQGGAIGCPSASCGAPPAAALDGTRTIPRLPEIRVPAR